MIPPPREEEYDLRDVVKVLRRRRSIIIGTVLVLTTSAAVVASNLTPHYTAVSTVLVEPRNISVVNFEDVRRDFPQDTSAINTHVKLITSNSFAHRVIDKTNLLHDPEFNIALRDGKTSGTLEGFIAGAPPWVKAPLVAVGLANDSPAAAPDRPRSEDKGVGDVPDPRIAGLDRSDRGPETYEASVAPVKRAFAHPAELIPDGDLGIERAGREGEGAEGPAAANGSASQEEERGRPPSTANRAHDALMAAATKIFLEQLAVGPSGESYAVSIAFTSVDPETAARVANAVADMYVEYQLESKRTTTTGALDWLDTRLNELRRQLIQADQAAETYRAENELLTSSGRGVVLGEQEMAALNQELIRARAERVEIEAKLRRIRDLLTRGESLEAVPEVMASPAIASLRQQQAQLMREEAQLRQEYGPRHPAIVQLRADADNLAARIGAEIQNIIGGLENQIATIRVQERTLQANLAQAKAGAVQTNQAEIQLRLLEREAESTRAMYATFLNRFKELIEQREMLDPGVRVISEAAVPAEPSFPRPKLVAGAAFMGSLMLATLLAFVVDRLDSGLRTGRQAEEVLKLPHIGLIPKVRRLTRGQTPQRYIAEWPSSAYAEAVRTIQTALQFSNVDRPPQVVLVTSSLPAEGKTTLALSLAAMLARSGSKTVAIDLDLRRPALGRGLREAEERGDLVDLVVGEKTLDEVLHGDEELSNLDILPVKRMTASPTDLLASKKMAAVIAELRGRYEYIILDSPPLLGINDSRFAALLADAVVFVVRWSKTKEELASKGLEVLRNGGAPIAGVVLTQVNIRRHRKYAPEDVAQYYGKYKKYYVN